MTTVGLREALGITKLDHVAIAVREIDKVLPELERLGWRSSHRFTDKEAGRSLMSLTHPEFAVRLEILEPAGKGSYLIRFLESHGPSQHHITFYVKDLEKARSVLEERGFKLHQSRPHEIIIHPRGGGGTMIQFFPHRTRMRMMIWRSRWMIRQHRSKILLVLLTLAVSAFVLWRKKRSVEWSQL